MDTSNMSCKAAFTPDNMLPGNMLPGVNAALDCMRSSEPHSSVIISVNVVAVVCLSLFVRLSVCEQNYSHRKHS